MRPTLVWLSAVWAAAAQSTTGEDIDRVLRFTNTETTADVQEISTVIRSVAEIRNVKVDSEQRSAAVRATAAQVSLAEWLATQLDRPAGQSDTPNAQEYMLPGGGDDVVRVFYVPKAETVSDLQEITIAIRSIAEIRRAFTYNRPRAVALRGTAAQIRMASWLFNELRTFAPGPASHEYRVSDGADDIIRVFYPNNADTVADLQQLSVAVRSTTEIRRAFTLNKARAVILRATGSDIALADWLISALEQPHTAAAMPAKEYRVPGSDDVIGVFYIDARGSAEELQQLAASVRASTQIRRMFTYSRNRVIAIRATAAQIAAADGLLKGRN
jgi:hypothetical protein